MKYPNRESEGRPVHLLPARITTEAHQPLTFKNEPRLAMSPTFNVRRAQVNLRPTFHDESCDSQRNSRSIGSISSKSDVQRKQEIVRKFREIQEKVQPYVGNHQKADDGLDTWDSNWQAQTEQKVLKLQNLMSSIKHKMELEIQKKLFEAEKEWNRKYNILYEGMAAKRGSA